MQERDGSTKKWYVNLRAFPECCEGPEIPLEVGSTSWGELKRRLTGRAPRRLRWELVSEDDPPDDPVEPGVVDRAPRARPSARLVHRETAADAEGRFHNVIRAPGIGGARFRVRTYKGAAREPRDELGFETWRKLYYSVRFIGESAEWAYSHGGFDLHRGLRQAFIELSCVNRQRMRKRPSVSTDEVKQIAAEMPDLGEDPCFKLILLTRLVRQSSKTVILPFEPYVNDDFEVRRGPSGIVVRYAHGVDQRVFKRPVGGLTAIPGRAGAARPPERGVEGLRLTSSSEGGATEIVIDDEAALREFGPGGNRRLGLIYYLERPIGAVADRRGRYIAVAADDLGEPPIEGRGEMDRLEDMRDTVMRRVLHELGFLLGLVHRASPEPRDVFRGRGRHNFDHPSASVGSFDRPADPSRGGEGTASGGASVCPMCHVSPHPRDEPSMCERCVAFLRRRDLSSL